MNKLVVAICMLYIFVSQVHGGELINGATITAVATASNNEDQFSLVTAGGTGPCVGQYLVFPLNSSPSATTWGMVYGSAVNAMNKGYTIRAYNYVDDDCHKATFLMVSKP